MACLPRPRRLLVAASLLIGLGALSAHAGETAGGPGPNGPGGAAAHAPGVGPVTSLPLPRYVSMRAASANARRGPSLDQRVDWEFVRRGMPLRVTAEYGNWRRVEDAEGFGGWVHHTLLSGVRTALVLGSETVPLREDPSEDSRIVAAAEPGAVAHVDACEGLWCEISTAGLEGWLQRARIWGVDPDETFD